MKAPTDKRNDTIQILVTTACDLANCSNCTQLLPFRRDTRHMSVECFREAVRSVKDWPGVVAMFGGNPCCHPQFPELCEILREEIPQQRRRGIWTNSYCDYGEIVADTFYPRGRFNVNAHGFTGLAAAVDKWTPGKLIRGSHASRSLHAPILFDWRDYNLTREDWVEIREACDINTNWSAAIVNRGGQPYAYFCEVAAALDGVRGENHGIPATPGWWRGKMEVFGDQVAGCCDRGCGVPLRRDGRYDRENTYDISPSWQKLTRDGAANSGVRIVVHSDAEQTCREATDYMQLRSKRGVSCEA